MLNNLTNNQWRRLAPLIGFFIITILLASGIATTKKAEIKTNAPLLGQTLPAFTLPLLGDPSAMFLSTLWQGKPAVINVFASWCEPCKAEHSLLLQLKEQGIPVYGIAWKDSQNKVGDYIKQLGNPFIAVGVDEKGLITLPFGLRGVPETFMIDGAGFVRWHFSGPLTQEHINQSLIPTFKHYEVRR